MEAIDNCPRQRNDYAKDAACALPNIQASMGRAVSVFRLADGNSSPRPGNRSL